MVVSVCIYHFLSILLFIDILALFSKPVSDRRSLPLPTPTKGSIYAAVQQQQAHQLSGLQSANGGSGSLEQTSQFKSAGDHRNFQPVRHFTQAMLNNPATPNSDEFSDPDGSVTSMGASVCNLFFVYIFS
jgi:hypothetical protein